MKPGIAGLFFRVAILPAVPCSVGTGIQHEFIELFRKLDKRGMPGALDDRQRGVHAGLCQHVIELQAK